MRHQTRAGDRIQCTKCRAAFAEEEAARRSAFPCPGFPLAHGHRYEREHVLYPFSYTRGDGYGPDRLCDDTGCMLCVGHTCDCDVCTDQLDVPDLKILMDSHEHGNRARSINWEEEDMVTELKSVLEGLKVEDHVTAHGVDARGHEVTRTGTLLTPPKDVIATRNGSRTRAVRVCVGAAGTDPDQRSTWTTLYPDSGKVELTKESKEVVWTNGELRNLPGIRGNIDGVRIHFGGKGGKRSTEPSEPVVLAGLTYTDDRKYEIYDVDTKDVLLTCSLQSRIWWAPAPAPAAEEPTAAELVDDKHQDEDQEHEERRTEAEDQEHDEHQGVTEEEHGQPIYHDVTRKLVGYWTFERFTPIEAMRDQDEPEL